MQLVQVLFRPRLVDSLLGRVLATEITLYQLWDFMPQAAREKFFADFATKLPLGFVADADDVASTYVYLMGYAWLNQASI